MMVSGINSYQLYASLFSNPMSKTDTSPLANTLFGASVTAMYSNKLNTILKKDMATYMQSFSTNITKLQTSASNLAGTNAASYGIYTNKLTKPQNTVLDTKKVESTDAKVAVGQALSTAETKSYKLSVDALAQAQIDETAKFKNNDFNSFGAGSSTIKVNYGAKSAAINVDIKAYYTNKEALNEVSSKINQSNIGVKSTYMEDANGNGYLQMTGKDTGAANKFEITDITGDLASRTGLNSVAQAASDAKYKVDGKEYTSAVNDIRINDNKVSVTLKGKGETTLNVTGDTKKISSSIEQFVTDYNDTLKFLKTNYSIGGASAMQLKNKLEETLKVNQDRLEDIGINITANGTLSIDKDRLNNAVEHHLSKVKNTLSGPTGVANKINKISENTLSQPLSQYLDMQTQINTPFNSSGMYSYGNTAQKQYFLKAQQQGILFDIMT